MKAFNFQYQRVLEVRQLKKDLASAEASRRLKKVQEAEHRVNVLNDQYTSTRNEMRRKLLEGRVQVGQLSGYSSYLFMLERNIRLAIGDLDSARHHHQESLAVVVRAKQDEEIFQKLRERDLTGWKKEMETLATAELDEMGGMRHHRRVNGLDGSMM